jgi:hypothetical protein
MNRIKTLRPTPALIVAMIALVAAMSGAAVALPGQNTVTSNDIANGAVTTQKIAKGAVGSQQIEGASVKGNRLKDGAIREKQIADGAVTAAKVADGVLTAAKLADGSVTAAKLADKAVSAAKIADGTVTGAQVATEGLSSKNISDYAVISSAAGNFVKLTATEAATAAAARTAAPESTLFSKGEITITAKCFRDTAADQTVAEMYVATSANGAIFDGTTDELSGGNAATDFLNTNTLDTDRVLNDTNVTGADANMNEGEFTILAADGTHLLGQTMIGAKNGVLAGGNGAYGAGNVCVFGGEISG